MQKHINPMHSENDFCDRQATKWVEMEKKNQKKNSDPTIKLSGGSYVL